MSTDLPPDAINYGEQVASLKMKDGGTIACGDCIVIAIPVPAPEPPSLARRMAEISVAAIHEHSPRQSVTWGEMTESGKDLVTASMQAVIDDLGLVCRDEVPTVTQAMEALGLRLNRRALVWCTIDGAAFISAKGAHNTLTAIGIRPDQEPDT